MARAIWSGSISFGMVSIPVKLYGATESKDISFHLLHKTDGTRLKQVRWCPTDEEEGVLHLDREGERAIRGGDRQGAHTAEVGMGSGLLTLLAPPQLEEHTHCRNTEQRHGAGFGIGGRRSGGAHRDDAADRRLGRVGLRVVVGAGVLVHHGP